ncbi:hypothetical protein SmJEL517_g01975 [Synchytrium microbalum]|uniref:C3HC-type domain-containing protein n=1 Tax=Synchytrium microbalum TaxID=1806994 RepID=A0A507CDT1_9FUNG|nr:uncharacterized protein SmJEL517_g01975 [Synchytrium microbalum]TPX35725.1 hypothetical protein SmJEL517_g01975 [Synchytrium microbalum]
MSTRTKRQLDEASTALNGNVTENDIIKLSDDGLAARLSTFKICLHVDLTWFNKPTDLSPVTCARHGWINHAADTLACTECQHRLICAFNTLLDDDGVKAMTSKFVEQLTSQHGRACIWRLTAIDESLYRFPLKSSSSTRSAFQNRFKSFVALPPSSIPQTACSLDQDTIAQIHNHTTTTTTSTILDVEKSCITLSLYGWLAEEQGGLRFAKCLLCMRSAGLWNFESVVPGSTSSAPRTKRVKIDDVEDDAESFDVLSQHRSFCPWISKGYTGKTGWQVTLDSLLSSGSKSSPTTSRIASSDVLSKVKEADNLLSNLLRQSRPTTSQSTSST